MAEPTRDHGAPNRPQHFEWSPAELAAYREMLDHMGGTDTTPGCGVCGTSAEGCETGQAMRRALRDATRARSGAHVRETAR